MKRPLEFVVPHRMALGRVKSRLLKRLPLSVDSKSACTRVFLDTFDWRIHEHGAVLEAMRNAGQSKLILKSLNSGEIESLVPVSRPPRLAEEIPLGNLHDRLSYVQPRALLPQVEVTSHREELVLRNAEDKIVLRLVLETNRLALNGSKRQLDKRVCLLPVRGYNKPIDRVSRMLSEELELAPAAQPLLMSALAAEDRRITYDASKYRVSLDPAMRADTAVQAILLEMAAAIEANLAGVRNGLDSECLHDFRIAVRRTRSALSQIKGVLLDEVCERFGPGFAWLGQVTGPTRDLDVYLIKFSNYIADFSPSEKAAMDPLFDLLGHQQETEQRILARELDSDTFNRHLREWRAFLESIQVHTSRAPRAGTPIRTVATDRIWSAYRRIVKQGRPITDESPPDDLHTLRKSCKKLRYLMEAFRSLYSRRKIDQLIKTLKQLQDTLGDYQDYQVQMVALRGFGRQLEREIVPRQTLETILKLEKELRRKQQESRVAFASIFASFRSRRHRRLFRDLFKQQPAPDGG